MTLLIFVLQHIILAPAITLKLNLGEPIMWFSGGWWFSSRAEDVMQLGPCSAGDYLSSPSSAGFLVGHTQ